MGCNASKNDQDKNLRTEQTLQGKKVNKNNREKEKMENLDQNDIENDWINAVKNENVKEGSLINPPDDLARDTKLEVALNQALKNDFQQKIVVPKKKMN